MDVRTIIDILKRKVLLASTNAVFLANKNAIFYLYIYPGEKLPDLLL